MTKHVVTIRDDLTRQRAIKIVSQAPFGYDVIVTERKRTKSQNNLMWPLLTTISVTKPEGYKIGTPHMWKCRFMNALGHECLSDIGLDGEPYAMGMSTSNLCINDFNSLVELIYAFGAQNSIDLTKDDATPAIPELGIA